MSLSAIAFLSLLTLATLTACAADEPPREPGGSNTRAPDGDRGPTDASLVARRTQRCDALSVSRVVDSAGVGPVLLGERVAALAGRCLTSDTAVTLGEGLVERAHRVAVGGRPLIALSTGTKDTAIIRVITTDPAFRTVGGVGVGSSVGALRAAHGRICAARGEGNLVVMAAELPGVSFAIDWSPPPLRDPSAAETPFPGGDPGTALDQSRITRLWVHGVTGGCRSALG